MRILTFLLCAALACGRANSLSLSPSERDAAERIAEMTSSDQGREALQELLQDEDQHSSSMFGMLSGVGSHREQLSSSSSSSAASGFKIPFYPKNSTVYDPTKSKSFHVVPKQMFLLAYADNSHLKGFQSKDVVQLGDFYVETKFGSITDCNSPDFNGVDGILGFGMPVQHQAAAAPQASGIAAMMSGGGAGQKPPATLPKPLLFALTDRTSRDNTRNKFLRRRAFSFLSTDCNTSHSKEQSPKRECKAEIQLGGYDPAAVSGKMFLTPSITINDYVVVALSLKFGDVELLEFTPKNPRLRYLPAIMDSGTSCLVMPDSTMNGLFKDSPYSKWKSIVQNTHKPAVKDNFYLNIAGATFEIPYDDWWLTLSNQSCVQKAPPGFGGLLVGDVLFRRFVVLFDLRHYPETVVIGIGKQNKDYIPAQRHATISKLPATKRVPTSVGTEHAPPKYKAPMAVDRIPIHNQEMTQYFINVSVGTPRQQFTVIFDTGSSVFGIFTRCIPNAPSYGKCTFGGGTSGDSGMLVEGAIMILTFAVLCSVIGIFANLYYQRRHDREEKLARSKSKGKNPSNSSYGPERLAGYYGAVP
mmetsp:Transcript_13271/g.30524  ORF Transcript_13271/g.30524 Transcript_13271/m.30524 type:complete len:585 (-) Transcript_13271:197-1951(-)